MRHGRAKLGKAQGTAVGQYASQQPEEQDNYRIAQISSLKTCGGKYTCANYVGDNECRRRPKFYVAQQAFVCVTHESTAIQSFPHVESLQLRLRDARARKHQKKAADHGGLREYSLFRRLKINGRVTVAVSGSAENPYASG
jgi:hypothetical protein